MAHAELGRSAARGASATGTERGLAGSRCPGKEPHGILPLLPHDQYPAILKHGQSSRTVIAAIFG